MLLRRKLPHRASQPLHRRPVATDPTLPTHAATLRCPISPVVFRAPTPPFPHAPPLIPLPAPGPDYDELASFLNNFLSPPDNFGEIPINAEEAQQLRRLGW